MASGKEGSRQKVGLILGWISRRAGCSAKNVLGVATRVE